MQTSVSVIDMAKVMISLPDGFLAEIDDAARKRHQTRSEFVRAAMREYLERRSSEGRGAEQFLLREGWEAIQRIASGREEAPQE
jgi:Arc/MetJ-type ribon-helix-helix transcriptional regulator